ncbi:hypothetical protein PMI42_05707 [Bradyrhizobium sp. YR681]|nr:hypothetical protein PMI42_05707 [Bradyrhizobium sp. YR681]
MSGGVFWLRTLRRIHLMDDNRHSRIPDALPRVTLLRRAGTHTRTDAWAPALQRTVEETLRCVRGHESATLGATLSRSSIASAAKQSRPPLRRNSGLLRCARNDGVWGMHVASRFCMFIADAPSQSRGAFCPSFAWSPHPPIERGRREDRVPAGHPRSTVRKVATRICTAAYRCSLNIRPSLRSGLTAYVVLSPGSVALLPPSPCG